MRLEAKKIISTYNHHLDYSIKQIHNTISNLQMLKN